MSIPETGSFNNGDREDVAAFPYSNKDNVIGELSKIKFWSRNILSRGFGTAPLHPSSQPRSLGILRILDVATAVVFCLLELNPVQGDFFIDYVHVRRMQLNGSNCWYWNLLIYNLCELSRDCDGRTLSTATARSDSPRRRGGHGYRRQRWYYDVDGRIVGRQFHEADSVSLIMLDAYRIARSTDGGSGYCCGTHEAPADPAPTEAPVMRRW